MNKKDKIKIITLVGSTKYKETFLREAKRLTIEGYIVLMPMVFSHSDGDKITEDQLKTLKEVHNEKIKMSDEVLIINEENYIGKGTIEEWAYARTLHKKIKILFPYPDNFKIPYYEKLNNKK